MAGCCAASTERSRSAEKCAFIAGGEAQEVDPLIASVEGAGLSPAYRGVALVVFEDLDLAEFGNRIPFLTFELVADEGPAEVDAVLADASGGGIGVSAGHEVLGFAAHGSSVRQALAPLIEAFGIRLFDDGEKLRSGSNEIQVIAASDYGFRPGDDKRPGIERDFADARDLPQILRLGFHDPDIDYQAGEARASNGDMAGREDRHEIAAVLAAGDAKRMAEAMLARRWAERDRITLCLATKRMTLEPGMTCLLEASPERWVIEEVAIEAFATRVVLTPAIASIPVLSASSGRFAAPLDVPPADPEIVLVEAAPALAQDNDHPTLLLAASSASPAYRPHTVIINAGGQETHVATSPHKAVIGTSLDQLGGAQTSALRDDMNRVTVTMVDPTCVLLSCDDEALAAGANLALLGEEYFQFAEARPEAPGTWVLSGLLRGRMGSEEAIADHAAGEPFVLIDPRRMSRCACRCRQRIQRWITA